MAGNLVSGDVQRLRQIAPHRQETVRHHRLTCGDEPVYRNAPEMGGELACRLRGEDHV